MPPAPLSGSLECARLHPTLQAACVRWRVNELVRVGGNTHLFSVRPCACKRPPSVRRTCRVFADTARGRRPLCRAVLPRQRVVALQGACRRRRMYGPADSRIGRVGSEALVVHSASLALVRLRLEARVRAVLAYNTDRVRAADKLQRRKEEPSSPVDRGRWYMAAIIIHTVGRQVLVQVAYTLVQVYPARPSPLRSGKRSRGKKRNPLPSPTPPPRSLPPRYLKRTIFPLAVPPATHERLGCIFAADGTAVMLSSARWASCTPSSP